MDNEAGGCLGAAIAVFIVLALIGAAMERAITAVGALISALWLPAVILTVLLLIGVAVVHMLEYEHRNRLELEQRAETTLLEVKALRERKAQERALAAAITTAKQHFDRINMDDELARIELFEQIRKQFRARIRLSAPNRDGKRHPLIEWNGAPSVSGEIHIYRGPIGLLPQWSDVERKIGDAGRIAIRPLSGDGKFVHFATAPGSTHCFYIYWIVHYAGTRPALEVGGVTKTNISPDDLRRPHQLTTISYRRALSGGFRSAELTIPIRQDALDFEEQDLLRAERKAELDKRWAKLGRNRKVSDAPEAMVEAAVRDALETARREDALDRAFEEEIRKIEADESLSPDAKELAIRLIQERLSQGGGDEWDA